MVDDSPLVRRNVPDDWTPVDTRAVDWVRVLAADAVQHCGSGHPGTAMSLAPVAYSLFNRVMRHDPADPHWPGRDRFVLSAGHSSLTLYIQLFLTGYGLEMEDLKQLRRWGSRTPGHPEYGHTPGVETTTGPLGQGLANAVGMAMAARRERGLFDPDSPAGESVFDHHVYVIASDGDIQEGVTSEASSLAGRQQLGNLVVIYDDNKISIEDDTTIALSEDTAARYAAYGWHVQTVEGGEDVTAIEAALAAAKSETDRPSLIVLRTIIGHPAPNKSNTGAAHGAALGDDEVATVKEILGFDRDEAFPVDDDVLAHTRRTVQVGRAAHDAWNERFATWAQANPEAKALWDRVSDRRLPDGWTTKLPAWEPGSSAVATRKASGEVINAVAELLPELWGGSADLAGSNNTVVKDAPSFGPEAASTGDFPAQPYGRNLHFGVREHAMAAIGNGITLHGPTRPYVATFLIFSDYMRPAVRLAALMQQPTIFVWTHDSIGLGEDGPTHQPIEHLSALRAIPGLNVARPADANETAAVWRTALETTDAPTGVCLTRQGVPVLDGTDPAGVARGGYVIAEADGDPELILIATGSEVQLALAARTQLQSEDVPTRVVSMPCVEWFDAADPGYRDSVLPPHVTARVAVEAGIAQSWHRFVGDAGAVVSLEHFGASADYQTLYREFGITADAVADAGRRVWRAADA